MQYGIHGQPTQTGNIENTFCHDHTTDQQRDTNTNDGDDRHRRILQCVTNQNDPRTQSFGLRRPDVILGENLQYAGPSNPCYEGDVHNPQRDTRQHQASKTRQKAVC